MVASSKRRLILAALALLGALLATGCARRMGPAPDLAGARRAIRVTAPKKVLVSTYERTPALEWRRFAIGQPSAPVHSLFQGSRAPCTLVPQGLTRVLAVPGGSPMRDLQTVGPVSVGVSGPPGTDFSRLFSSAGGAWAPGLLARVSYLGTNGNGCAGGIFAYVRLGLGGSYDPVAVYW